METSVWIRFIWPAVPGKDLRGTIRMTGIKTLCVTSRKQWRKWLEKNHDKEKEIFLINPRGPSGKRYMKYNDIVEEALCFGWIDSTGKRIDETTSAQRFTPRRPKSSYSQSNKERLRWLAKENMLIPSIKEAVKDILKEEYVFPPDILNAIKKDRTAWKNFKGFSDSYRRIRVSWVDAARDRPDEFKKRLRNLIEKTRKNKQFGFGGIEKYY